MSLFAIRYRRVLLARSTWAKLFLLITMFMGSRQLKLHEISAPVTDLGSFCRRAGPVFSAGRLVQ